MKKTLSIVLALVLALSLALFGGGLAAAESRLAVTLTPAKTTLAAGESTALTLTVTNNNGIRMYVSASAAASAGTISGSAITAQNTAALGQVSANLTYTAPAAEPTPDPTPSDGSGSTGSTGSGGRTVPNTGDGVSPFVWLGLAALSAAALIVLARKGKKLGGKGLLSLLVCAVLLTAFGLPAPRVTAVTDDTGTGSCTLTAAGKPVTLTATATAELPTFNYTIVREYASQPTDGTTTPAPANITGTTKPGGNYPVTINLHHWGNTYFDGNYTVTTTGGASSAVYPVSVTAGVLSADGSSGYLETTDGQLQFYGFNATDVIITVHYALFTEYHS